MTKQEILFLKESNAIEDVWDEKSLLKSMQAWLYILSAQKLTIKNILRTHKILMEGKLDKLNLGHFRRVDVWIGGHSAKSPELVPVYMDNWIQMANDTVDFLKGKLDAEDEIKLDHIQFEAIHPFIDGNGRMGRILLNWQRIKAQLPILVIKEEEKYDYYEWFM